MSKSKPYDLAIMIWKPVWESSPRYKGNSYGGTTRDLRAAKEWFELNPFDEIDIAEFQERALLYIKDDFQGFVNANHPLCLFLAHYTRYGIKRRQKKLKIFACDLHPEVGQYDEPMGCPKCYARQEVKR